MNLHRKIAYLAFAGALLACKAQSAIAAPVTYDFDSFSDSTILTNQISGLTFANAVVLRAGASLNDTEFPPRSGAGVVFDNGGAITMTFASPVFEVGAYFTYLVGLNFAAFDSLNNLLGTDLPGFASNLALSGDVGSSPNEFLSFSSATGQISKIVITGGSQGGSFTMDDLTFNAGTVPEPPTLVLIALLLAAGTPPGGWLRIRRKTKTLL